MVPAGRLMSWLECALCRRRSRRSIMWEGDARELARHELTADPKQHELAAAPRTLLVASIMRCRPTRARKDEAP
eukprot:3337723-Prymnesium_polylepis.2